MVITEEKRGTSTAHNFTAAFDFFKKKKKDIKSSKQRGGLLPQEDFMKGKRRDRLSNTACGTNTDLQGAVEGTSKPG